MDMFATKHRADGSLLDARGAGQEMVSIKTQREATNYEMSSEEDDERSFAEHVKMAPVKPKNIDMSERPKPIRVPIPKEYDHGHGPNDSQVFLDAVKHNTRNKKSSKANRYLGEFKDALIMQERDLNNAIEEGEVQLLARDMKYLDAIRCILTPLIHGGTIGEVGDRPLAMTPDNPTHGLQHESAMAVSRALSLIDLFQDAAAGIGCIETVELTAKSWDNDLRETKQILDTGKCGGEWRIERILSSSHGGLPNADATIIWDRFYMGANGYEDGAGWARAARKHEKAVVRLVTTLSREL